jgi:queuine/archaeosine tRNA-ribosyltransferase
MVNLVDRMREAIEEGNFAEYKAEFLARYKNSD